MALRKSLMLWGCSFGFLVVPHLLLLIKKSLNQEEEKLPQANSSIPLGTTIRRFLSDSSSALSAKLRSTSAVIYKPIANYCRHKIISTNFDYYGPYTMLKGEKIKQFEQNLRSKTVLLEKYQLESDKEKHAIKGVIAALNVKQVKNVFLRYTKDNWNSFADVSTKFVSSCCTGDGTTFDRFEFELPFFTDIGGLARDEMSKGAEMLNKLEFAIAYQAHNTDYWDNNHGKNYQLSLKTSMHKSYNGR